MFPKSLGNSAAVFRFRAPLESIARKSRCFLCTMLLDNTRLHKITRHILLPALRRLDVVHPQIAEIAKLGSLSTVSPPGAEVAA